MAIEYRTIGRFPGYRFGSDGSVWTCKVRGGVKRWKISDDWRRMSPAANRKGYQILVMRPPAMGHQVHRLILEAFTGPCPDGMEGCHNDGNPENNDIGNLRWDTRKGNHADKKRHGTSQVGSRCGLAKLNETSVASIIKSRFAGQSRASIAAEFGIHVGTIDCIMARKTWRHVDFDSLIRGARS